MRRGAQRPSRHRPSLAFGNGSRVCFQNFRSAVVFDSRVGRPSRCTGGVGVDFAAYGRWLLSSFCGVCLVRLRRHHVTRTWRLAMDSAIKVARRDLASRCTCACARSLCVCVAAEWLASISRTCGRRIGVIFGCFRDGLQLSHAPEGILPHPPAPPPRR